MVKWNRSEDGYTESKCGHFRIEPIFMGRTTAQAYHLYADGVKVMQYCDTQREAKEYAERYFQK